MTPSAESVSGFRILEADGVTVVHTTAPEQLSFTVSKLPGSRTLVPGHRYCFQVVAVTADATSPPGTVCASTNGISAVRSLAASSTPGTITVTWLRRTWKPPHG